MCGFAFRLNRVALLGQFSKVLFVYKIIYSGFLRGAKNARKLLIPLVGAGDLNARPPAPKTGDRSFIPRDLIPRCHRPTAAAHAVPPPSSAPPPPPGAPPGMDRAPPSTPHNNLTLPSLVALGSPHTKQRPRPPPFVVKCRIHSGASSHPQLTPERSKNGLTQMPFTQLFPDFEPIKSTV